MLSNTTAIGEAWARLDYKFDLMYAKRRVLIVKAVFYFFLILCLKTNSPAQSVRLCTGTLVKEWKRESSPKQEKI